MIADIPIVAIYYDIGETKALRGVFQELEQKGVDYRIITVATASLKALEIGYPEEKIIKVADEDVQWERESELSPSSLAKVVEKIAGLKPEVVITGAVSRVQHQIGELFECKKFAYYDNMNLLISDNPAEKTIRRFFEGYQMLVPSQAIAKGISDKNPIVVGHPELEALAGRVSLINPNEIKERLNIPVAAKVITYIGGYGGTYLESLNRFDEMVKKLQQRPAWNSLHVVIQLHPKVQNETDLPEDKISSNHVHVSRGEVTTEEALAVASLVISAGSTVTPQAACAGIPSHFVMKGSNLFVDQGLCKIVENAEELEEHLQAGKQTSDTFHRKAGIPMHSKNIIRKTIYSKD